MAVLNRNVSMESPTFFIVSCRAFRRSGSSLNLPEIFFGNSAVLSDVLAPDLFKEAHHALYAVGVPRLLVFERAEEHFVEAQGVRAVAGDYVVGIDDIAAALAHFVRARVHYYEIGRAHV